MLAVTSFQPAKSLNVTKLALMSIRQSLKADGRIKEVRQKLMCEGDSSEASTPSPTLGLKPEDRKR